MTAAGVSGVAHEGSHAAAGEADAKPVEATEPAGATDDAEVDADGAGAGLHAAARYTRAVARAARMAHRRRCAVSGSVAISP